MAALAYSDPADMERVTTMQSRMTHYDPRCAEACILYNRIAERLLQGGNLRAAILAETAGSEYEGIIEAEPDCPPSGFVVHTFRWVLHILLHAPDFAGVVQQAANLGGDSDTIGAIAAWGGWYLLWLRGHSRPIYGGDSNQRETRPGGFGVVCA